MKDYFDQNGEFIEAAIIELKAGNFANAKENIKQAMSGNPHSPVPHNLYGILQSFNWMKP